MQRWTLTDDVALETLTFPFNPQNFTEPTFEKSIGYAATAAPDGKTLIWEGRPQPQRLSFDGVIYTTLDDTTFKAWWDKTNQVTLTDDLGNTLTIYLTKYAPKRERKSSINPVRRSYTIEAIVLDWA